MIRIVSDGTCTGTHLYNDQGDELKGVRRVTIDISAGADVAHCNVEFMMPLVDMQCVDTEYTEKVCALCGKKDLCEGAGNICINCSGE